MKAYAFVFVVALCLALGPTFVHAADESPKGEGTAVQSSKEGAAQEDTKYDADDEAKKDEIRRAIMVMKDKTLDDLYKSKPEAKAEVESAVGYGVFDATGVNLLLLVGVKGEGVVIENGSKKATYMKVRKLGTGPGLGYKDYRMVLIFTSKTVFDNFIKLGMDIGASADATMKLSEEDKGSEVQYAKSFNPNIKIYQITDKGLLLQANWGGTKFTKDKDLNEKEPEE